MRTLTEYHLRDLISTIDRADRQSYLLGKQLRGHLIRALEACMVDAHRLRAYLQVLQEVLHNHARYRHVACLENKCQRRAIAERGLRVLENTDLCELALNPLALCALSKHIMESVVTNHWTGVSAQVCADQVESFDPLKNAAYRAGSWVQLVDLLGPSLFMARGLVRTRGT